MKGGCHWNKKDTNTTLQELLLQLKNWERPIHQYHATKEEERKSQENKNIQSQGHDTMG
jgi:hypothetical protein